MKYFLLVAISMATFSVKGQNSDQINIILDGQPAVLNVKTGETKLLNGQTIKEGVVVPKGDSENIITVHTVLKGETLYSISKTYGISIAQLKAVNNLSNNLINVNQTLKIGYDSSREIKNYWKVKKGDTLYAIARQTGLSVDVIKRINNLQNNIIKIDQVLLLK